MKELKKQMSEVKKQDREKERVEFMELYIKYGSKIPTDYMRDVILAHPDWKPQRIENVRYGRTHDVKIFREIVNLTIRK